MLVKETGADASNKIDREMRSSHHVDYAGYCILGREVMYSDTELPLFHRTSFDSKDGGNTFLQKSVNF
jgi:hypothetical protein